MSDKVRVRLYNSRMTNGTVLRTRKVLWWKWYLVEFKAEVDNTGLTGKMVSIWMPSRRVFDV